jgi:hypothetical protein
MKSPLKPDLDSRDLRVDRRVKATETLEATAPATPTRAAATMPVATEVLEIPAVAEVMVAAMEMLAVETVLRQVEMVAAMAAVTVAVMAMAAETARVGE